MNLITVNESDEEDTDICQFSSHENIENPANLGHISKPPAPFWPYKGMESKKE